MRKAKYSKVKRPKTLDPMITPGQSIDLERLISERSHYEDMRVQLIREAANVGKWISKLNADIQTVLNATYQNEREE